jgi:hypothetical protein
MKIVFFLLLSALPFNHVQAQYLSNQQLLEIADDFIPPFYEFAALSNPPGSSAIDQYDVDKDGQNEIFLTLKEVGESKLTAVLLKKEDGKWSKAWETRGEGFGVDFTEFRDVTNDGKEELLIGWAVGASAGNTLDIFEWRNNTYDPIGKNPFYHKVEFIESDTKTSMAIWNRYCCDTYIVNVLSWEEGKFVHDEEMYKQYYPKIKVFYEKKIEKMDAWFYWYSLADAQIKAGLLNDAKESIRKGLSLSKDNEELLLLKETIDKENE